MVSKTLLEEHKMVVLSTGHVRLETADDLGVAEFGFVVAEFPEGAFVSCHSTPDENPCGDRWPDLHAVRLWARDAGYGYLMLDRDGGVAEGLPVYEW